MEIETTLINSNLQNNYNKITLSIIYLSHFIYKITFDKDILKVWYLIDMQMSLIRLNIHRISELLKTFVSFENIRTYCLSISDLIMSLKHEVSMFNSYLKAWRNKEAHAYTLPNQKLICALETGTNFPYKKIHNLLKNIYDVYLYAKGGTAPPTKTPKLACFVLYLEIINIFLKNNICIL